MTDDTTRPRRGDAVWVVALALVIGAFYLVTLRPDVGGTEDSPKFQFLGQVLGTAHTPGYPFYTIATYLFTRLPIGRLAYEVNLFSAVSGVLSCLCIFWMARRLGVTRLLSAVAAIAAATSFPLWSNSIVAEVYTLAALMSALTILWLMIWTQDGQRAWLYAACAVFAAGLGNHLTIVALLPAALLYGVAKDRSVLRARVIGIAALIGAVGVGQYGFIALRTFQRAPYLEARATTLQGIYDVIIARDVSWARFYQAADKVVGIEIPMLLDGLRVHMGAPIMAFVIFAIVIAVRRKQFEVLLIAGGAAGTLGMIANLWGDVVGFITPVVVLLWPLAAYGLQTAIRLVTAREVAVTAAGILAVGLPLTNVPRLRPAIAIIRAPGDTPALRTLYGHLPAGSALVGENYFIARILNYLHFSTEYDPDPNPQLLQNNADQVKAAAAEGLPVFALEGAMPGLTSQGLIFEATGLSQQPIDRWIAEQPAGTVVVVASAGRLLPVEWLPNNRRVAGARPAAFGALAWAIGGPPARVEQSDSGVVLQQEAGADGHVVTVTANDEGPRIQWGDTVLSAIDRGLVVVAFEPSGRLAANWAFAPGETVGARVPPAALVYRGERPCAVLRPGQRTNVSDVLADGGWWATFDGSGTAAITLDSGIPAAWRHERWLGRGKAAVDAERSRLVMNTVSGRAVYAFSMPRPTTTVHATLESDSGAAVRICQAAIPEWPATGALDVSMAADARFGGGWHWPERQGAQHFRWSARTSTLRWRLAQPADVRLWLYLRAADADGATVRATIKGREVGVCTLAGGAWTDCPLSIEMKDAVAGVNELVLTSDTVAPGRAGDSRELAFVMQAGRVRVGR